MEALRGQINAWRGLVLGKKRMGKGTRSVEILQQLVLKIVFVGHLTIGRLSGGASGNADDFQGGVG